MTESTLIIYSSKNGASETYANEIARRLNLIARPLNRLKKRDLDGCETLIYCAGIYISKIRGLKKLRKLSQDAPCRNYHFFVAGLSEDNQATIEKLRLDNQEDLPSPVSSITYARGIFEVSKMGFFTRIMFRVLYRILAKKTDPSPEETGLMEAIKSPVYAIDLTKTESLITALKEG